MVDGLVRKGVSAQHCLQLITGWPDDADRLKVDHREPGRRKFSGLVPQVVERSFGVFECLNELQLARGLLVRLVEQGPGLLTDAFGQQGHGLPHLLVARIRLDSEGDEEGDGIHQASAAGLLTRL